MQKTLPFNQLDTLVVMNETISGIALDFTTLQADGTTLAALSDYNKISLEIFVLRNGQNSEPIFNGYLEDALLALYAQTPSFELYRQAYGNNHKVKIDFGGNIALSGDDQLKVRLRAQNTSFTSLSVANSSIAIETIPAVGGSTPIYVIDEIGIPAGETNLTLPLQDNVVKVVAVTDRSANYFASTEAKFDGVEIIAEGGYSKNVTKELLELENISMFNNNPESEIEDMVLFASDIAIHGATLRGKLTKAALADSKIMVVRRVFI